MNFANSAPISSSSLQIHLWMACMSASENRYHIVPLMMGVRVVSREDRAKHVKRTDIRRGLAAPVRVRGEDEVSERLLQHGGNKYIKSPPRRGKRV